MQGNVCSYSSLLLQVCVVFGLLVCLLACVACHDPTCTGSKLPESFEPRGSARVVVAADPAIRICRPAGPCLVTLQGGGPVSHMLLLLSLVSRMTGWSPATVLQG